MHYVAGIVGKGSDLDVPVVDFVRFHQDVLDGYLPSRTFARFMNLTEVEFCKSVMTRR